MVAFERRRGNETSVRHISVSHREDDHRFQDGTKSAAIVTTL